MNWNNKGTVIQWKGKENILTFYDTLYFEWENYSNTQWVCLEGDIESCMRFIKF